jgi:hypothetical protein
MKKSIVLTALLMATGISVSIAGSRVNPARLSGIIPVCSIAEKGDWDFEFSYKVGNVTVRVTGIIYMRGDNGEISGVIFVTITDDNGNTLTWDEPFNIQSANTGPLFQQYPEVGRQFLYDVAHIGH